MNYLKYMLVVLSLLLVGFNEAIAENAKSDVFFLEQKLKECRMRVEACDYLVAIANKTDVADLAVSTTNPTVFEFKSIEKLDENSTLRNNETLSKVDASFDLYTIKIKPVLVGRANLTIRQNSTQEILASRLITIIRPNRVIDHIFDIFLWIFCGFVSLLMGILFDTEIFLKMVEIPKEIALSFCCQYFLMPMVTFWICKLFGLNPLESLAFFIFGCSPSTLDGNQWATSFDGDFEFSTILTLITTVSSLVMMPVWLYSLGLLFMKESNIYIPFIGLLKNLAVLILPCMIGVIIGYAFPKIKKAAKLINKIQSVVLNIFFLVILIVSKFYATKFSRAVNAIPGPLIAILGYLLGAFLSWVLRFPRNQIKTIAINTGLKNLTLAILIVNTNIPSPDVDYVLFCLVPAFFQSSIPLKLCGLGLRIKKCIKKRRLAKSKSDQESTAKDPKEADSMMVDNQKA